MARPEEYILTFIDEGESMVKFLHLARSRQIETEYVTGRTQAIAIGKELKLFG